MIKYNDNTINKIAMDSTVNKLYYGENLLYVAPPQGEEPIPEHTVIEYIQTSSGSSKGCIQLLNNPKEGLKIEIDFQVSGTSEFQIIGQKDNKEVVSYQMGFMQYNSNTRGYYDYGGGRIGIYDMPSTSVRRTWTIGRISGATNTSIVGFSCDGTVQTSSVTTLRFANDRPYLCGSGKYNGSSTPEFSNLVYMKIYSIKIYEDYGETLVGDYIPVKKQDGTYTLYDTITKTYAIPYGTVVGSE